MSAFWDWVTSFDIVNVVVSDNPVALLYKAFNNAQDFFSGQMGSFLSTSSNVPPGGVEGAGGGGIGGGGEGSLITPNLLGAPPPAPNRLFK